ncbi:MAG: hypothetical protein JWO56_2144 [Acidobacteria bacterium]|nr:hypothetical protein [Acidobacteriota bacterium]
MNPRSFDVVIAGRGPAGLAVALALASESGSGPPGEQPLSIAAIDRPVARPRFGETLPPGSRPLLARLGILRAFLAGPHARCEGTMAAWGSSEVRFTDYLLHPERHGWRLDRGAFEAMLASEASRRGVTLIDGTVKGIERADSWHMVLGGHRQDDAEITARVLVDATGRSAALARRLGGRRIVDDRLVGIAGIFDSAAAIERGYPLIEACEHGWIYSTIIPDGRLAVVVMTDSDLAHAQRLHDPSAWRAFLAATPHTARRMGGATLIAEPAVASANSQRLDIAAGDGWLATGDAASALDPLSSQGIVKALRSGLDAAAAIRAHLGGNGAALAAYTQAIATDYRAYLDTRARYYAMETRWADAPFWQRRAREREALPEPRSLHA